MINDTLTYLSKEMASEKPVNADLPSLLSTVCSDFFRYRLQCDLCRSGTIHLSLASRDRWRAPSPISSTNSTKFAGHAIVELSVLENGTVRISVIDEGPGLLGGLRTLALEPFFKADTARTPGRPHRVRAWPLDR